MAEMRSSDVEVSIATLDAAGTSEGPTFTANYDGQCSGVRACNLPIKEGQHSLLGEQRINFTFRTAG